MDSKTIASTLGLRSRRVRKLTGTILTKLRVHSRMDAVDSFPLEASESDHPHLTAMDETQLLNHLRSRHGYNRRAMRLSMSFGVYMA
jgi:hypothetical protein